MNLDVSRNNTRDRVFYGKQVEQSILNTLKHLGYDITPASLYEDTQEKIDGYIKIDGKLIPVQIKYRSKKNDIISEITCIDDVYGNQKVTEELMVFDGRDYVSSAILYISLGSDCKTLRICLTKDIKTIGKKLAIILLNKWGKNKNIKSYYDNTGEVKIIKDNFSGRRKIIYFAKPDKNYIPSLVTLDLNKTIIVN